MYAISISRVYQCILILSPVLILAAIARADGVDYAGRYHGEKLSAEIDPAGGGGYAGSLELGGSQFPMKASEQGGQLQGTFTSHGQDYAFTATLNADELTLRTGATTYSLARPPSANPLDNNQSGIAALAGGQPGTLIFSRHKIHDDTSNLDAFTVLVPDSWTIDTKMSCVPIGQGLAILSMVLADPKSGGGIVFYPPMTFADGEAEANERTNPYQRQFWQSKVAGTLDGSGLELEPSVASPADYVSRYVIPRYRPDLKTAEIKVVSKTDFPADQLNKAAAAASPYVHNLDVQESLIRIQYAVQNAQIEEQFDCKITHLPIPQGWSKWTAEVKSARAPAGQLDPVIPIMDAVACSLTPQYAWWNERLQVFNMMIKQSNDMNQQMIVDSMARFNAVQQMYAQISADESAEAKQHFADVEDANAKAHEEMMNYITDTQDYKDPSGDGTIVNLPYNHLNNLGDGNGHYIQNDIPNYVPPVGFQPMEKAPGP